MCLVFVNHKVHLRPLTQHPMLTRQVSFLHSFVCRNAIKTKTSTNKYFLICCPRLHEKKLLLVAAVSLFVNRDTAMLSTWKSNSIRPMLYRSGVVGRIFVENYITYCKLDLVWNSKLDLVWKKFVASTWKLFPNWIQFGIPNWIQFRKSCNFKCSCSARTRGSRDIYLVSYNMAKALNAEYIIKMWKKV